MASKSKNISYYLRLIPKRIQDGQVLFSIRNLLIRVGIHIGPYYWVREGAYPIDEPDIRLDPTKCKVSYFDLKELEEIKKTETSFGSDFTGLLKDGQKCLGIKVDDEIAAFMFIQYDDLLFRGRMFRLDENEVYLQNMFTYEKFRGKNLAPYLRFHCYQLLNKEGIDNIFSVTTYFNKSAMNFKKKLKAQNLQLNLYLILFKKYTWNYTLRNYT